MAESSPGANFVVACNDAIYCYTADGKGPCYAVEGDKVLIQGSKTYLVIVSKDVTNSSTPFLTTRVSGYYSMSYDKFFKNFLTQL